MDCHYCSKSKEVRPYGPKGEWICFECAFASSDRKAQTEAAYTAQLNAAGPMAIIGEGTGPRPLEGGTQ
jgi:hypothetical protein